MADTKISGVSAVTTLGTTEEFPLALAGASKKITSANLKATIRGNRNIPSDYDQTSAIATATGSRFNTASVSPLKGNVYGRRIRLYPGSYTSVTMAKHSTVGSGHANCFLALYNVSTLALVNSVNITTVLEAQLANTTQAFTFNNTIAAEADYIIALLIGNSTTTACSLVGETIPLTALCFLPPAQVYHHSSASLDALPDPLVAAATNFITIWFQYS